jgi:starch synthase (maltosyl-transferring)
LAAEHTADGKTETLIVVVNTDPHAIRETTVHIDVGRAGIHADEFEVVDLLTKRKYSWTAHNFVRIDPRDVPGHVFKVTKVK